MPSSAWEELACGILRKPVRYIAQIGAQWALNPGRRGARLSVVSQASGSVFLAGLFGLFEY
jgi:hypothetical protein